MKEKKKALPDETHEGRDKYYMDIDRKVNEGLGGGQVTEDNGLIDEDNPITTETEPHTPGKSTSN
ncbi:hypothetical protein [Bacillus horti]|uniref:DUF4025 domain-containing protein n=1 Tax=Caldalkalibacillus horti TaxID=77523 RepID=A0ABT9W0T6_9BACI|nr:hypothetical protein [Bacillus horti]MDQ0166667.1 hypothetical protein [Bacillus horti]